MSWYAQMMKSQEIARGKNKREARRAENQKCGTEFVAQYRLAAIDKERKLIEKELERIRAGIHRPPKLDDKVRSKEKHVLTVTSPTRLRPTPLFGGKGLDKDGERSSGMPGSFLTQSINPVYSEDETKLYDAILFLQHNPSALVPILAAHAQSDAYLETLGRITPRLQSGRKDADLPIQPFVPSYLRDKATKTEKVDMLNKYTALLHRHSPILRKSSPLRSRRHDSPKGNRDSPLVHGENVGNISFRSSAPLPPIDGSNTARTDKRLSRSDLRLDLGDDLQSSRSEGYPAPIKVLVDP